LDDLVDAHNSASIANGRKMEAILCRYSDIDSYEAARAAYYKAKGIQDDNQPVSIPVCYNKNAFMMCQHGLHCSNKSSMSVTPCEQLPCPVLFLAPC
jgi:hypothetical protein